MSLSNLNGSIYVSSIFDSIPEIEITAKSDSTSLPFMVYNNEHSYFPPVFYQIGASCTQTAEIGYCFSYEINRARNVPAGNWMLNKSNCYHPSFTYNFLNNGSGSTGTINTSGFEI